MRARIAVLLSVVLCATGCVSPSKRRVAWMDDAVVYQPSGPYEDGWQPPGLKYEDVDFESADGTRLHGWYCPVEEPLAIVLYAHGNAGNLQDRWRIAKGLNEQCQVSVMLFDYRGYGKSEGSPTEKGVLADARAAREWLAGRAGIPGDQIVIYGRSLGGGVAVDLAANDGARALVLESTFTSLPDVANQAFSPMPVGVLMRNKFRSAEKLPGYQGPLFVAHGDADKVIPIEQGRSLFAVANQPKSFYRIVGQGHNWTPTADYYQALRGFLEQVARGKPMAVSRGSEQIVSRR